jgi:2-polyprenyl-3-methyl-5-hydroxy-6-metoxy-1,4-benzoquinol methylase
MLCPLCLSPSTPMAPHPEASLFRCGTCRHAFTDSASISQPEQYDASYFDHDHKRWFEHPNLELFNLVLSQVLTGASLADVGCGRCDFLRYARTKRPDLKLTGIDLSANPDLPGIRFIQGDILTLPIEERFDVVTSLMVIEHIAEVRSFVRRMQQLTKPGGVVAITTINDGSLLYRAGRVGRTLGIPLAYNRLYSAHHLQHFTRSSLAGLLRDGGCQLTSHLDHNAPIEAMDLPVTNRALDAILRVGLRVLWLAGRATTRSYAQTVICTTPQSVPLSPPAS